MVKELDVWTSEQAKEILLCIAESPKTQKQIIKKTQYYQGRVSEILKLLEREKLIKEHGKARTVRKPQIVWDIDPQIILDTMVSLEFPLWPYGLVKGKKLTLVLVNRYYKELPALVRPFLKKLSRAWHGRRWKGNLKERDELIGFTLASLSNNFIRYLMINEKKLNAQQRKEFDTMLKLHFSILDPYITETFKDKTL